VHDVNILDEILPEPGAFYVMDRGYLDFERLYGFTASGAFFVLRTKSNVILQRRYSRAVDKTTGVRSDHTVILTAFNSAQVYPDALRRVSYPDVETRQRFKFLTNNFVLPALTIAQSCKARWQVELFFKWIKQHLRIKAFYSTSENAVKTQIWIAVSVYELVAIVRKRLGLGASLYQILQIPSVTLFEKTPILVPSAGSNSTAFQAVSFQRQVSRGCDNKGLARNAEQVLDESGVEGCPRVTFSNTESDFPRTATMPGGNQEL